MAHLILVILVIPSERVNYVSVCFVWTLGLSFNRLG